MSHGMTMARIAVTLIGQKGSFLLRSETYREPVVWGKHIVKHVAGVVTQAVCC